MPNRTSIYHLLEVAIEILRREGNLGGDNRIERIAGVISALPSSLDAADRGERDYDSVLSELRHVAQQEGASKWLQAVATSRNGTTEGGSDDTRAIIYNVLYLALVEIRSIAYEARRSKLFDVADLVHAVPLLLERTEDDPGASERIWQTVRSRAEAKGETPLLDRLLGAASHDK